MPKTKMTTAATNTTAANPVSGKRSRAADTGWDEPVGRKDRKGESDDQRKINPKPLEPKMDVFPVGLGKCVRVVQHSGVVASPDTLLGVRKTGGKTK